MSVNKIPIAKVELSEDEITAAVKVLKSGMLIQGKKVEEFERAFKRIIDLPYGEELPRIC